MADDTGDEVDVDYLYVNDGGVLLGNGSVRINNLLSNSGAIAAIAGPNDELALLGGPVDLDGNGSGEVFAILGNLRVSANTIDAFDGRMTIGAGRQVQLFGNSWQIGQSSDSDAEIILNGGDETDPARLIKTINNMTFIGGTLEVGGYGIIEGLVVFEDGFVSNIQTGGTLIFEDHTTYRGGIHQGGGALQFNGSVAVEADTSLTVSTVDLDGATGTTMITITDAALTLDVDQVDTSDNRFDGVINLDGPAANLAVNFNNPGANWQMNGTFNANGGLGAPQDKLTGSAVHMTGTIYADNNVQFSAPMDISGNVALVDSSSEFWLANATHVIRNTANVSGAGQVVVADTGTLLIEDGSTIDAEVFNIGRLEPGTKVGTVLINNDYSQSASGSLGIELSGAPFANQDLIEVGGTANLSGELEVTVIDDTMPSIGPTYTLLTADVVSGQFDTFTLLADSIFSYEATLSYTAVRVALEFTDVTMFGDFSDDLSLGCEDVDALVAEIAAGGANLDFDMNDDAQIDINDLNEWLSVAGTFNVGGPYLGGDANLDGFVDGLDMIEWNGNKFTANAAWCSGDFNADGFVDGLDFIIWNGNKFMASDVAAVPEPTSLLLLAAIGLAALKCRS